MSLGETELARIDALLEAIGPTADSAMLDHALKRLLPDLQCSHCDASDVLEDPFRSAAMADLHLLDTRNHCVTVTTDPAAANGVLIARKVPA